MTSCQLTDSRSEKKNQHSLTLTALQQSGYSRLAEYEDTNDAEHISVAPDMRHVVGERAKEKNAASVSQIERFEIWILTQTKNLEVLMSQTGKWIDEVNQQTVVSVRLWKKSYYYAI